MQYDLDNFESVIIAMRARRAFALAGCLTPAGPAAPLRPSDRRYRSPTPGFLMLAVSILEHDPDIAESELREALSSNLCRCTGYQNILKSVLAAAAEMRK